LTLPANTFWSPVAPRTTAEQTSEDELLARLQALRTQGGLVCGTNPVTSPVAALRLDARLSCAARVFADDRAAHGGTQLLDSQGRSTTERLALANYTATLTTEGFATSASSAQQAIDLILSVESSCRDFASATFVDVGVAVSGDVYVVTMAAP
jgi:uncharacterized protein YkwD